MNAAGTRRRPASGARRTPAPWDFGRACAAAAALLVLCGACDRQTVSPLVEPHSGACRTRDDDPLKVGFYAFFAPVSYAADSEPGSAGFHMHRGYEAALLTALEAMEGANLSFSRRPVADWPGIWLLPATPDFDIAGGGITILESRTLDSAGHVAVTFTSGHIAFRQSLLVLAADAERFSTYDALTGDVRVGVLAGTTGEARLLQITGIADDDGVLVAGTRVETPRGPVVADGSAAYVITAGHVSPALEGRTHLLPPRASMPQVVYLGEAGETEFLEALRDGTIDAFARGEVGNGEVAHSSGGNLVVAAVDSLAEYGGFALDAGDTKLVACLDDKIDWLTNGRRIGYAEWRTDPEVFEKRAALWEGGP